MNRILGGRGEVFKVTEYGLNTTVCSQFWCTKYSNIFDNIFLNGQHLFFGVRDLTYDN